MNVKPARQPAKTRIYSTWPVCIWKRVAYRGQTMHMMQQLSTQYWDPNSTVTCDLHVICNMTCFQLTGWLYMYNYVRISTVMHLTRARVRVPRHWARPRLKAQAIAAKLLKSETMLPSGTTYRKQCKHADNLQDVSFSDGNSIFYLEAGRQAQALTSWGLSFPQ